MWTCHSWRLFSHSLLANCCVKLLIRKASTMSRSWSSRLWSVPSSLRLALLPEVAETLSLQDYSDTSTWFGCLTSASRAWRPFSLPFLKATLIWSQVATSPSTLSTSSRAQFKFIKRRLTTSCRLQLSVTTLSTWETCQKWFKACWCAGMKTSQTKITLFICISVRLTEYSGIAWPMRGTVRSSMKCHTRLWSRSSKWTGSLKTSKARFSATLKPQSPNTSSSLSQMNCCLGLTSSFKCTTLMPTHKWTLFSSTIASSTSLESPEF